ncbi:MAG: hypothetical protein AMXMBFR64_14040 [Myxococcales bacterium]
MSSQAAMRAGLAFLVLGAVAAVAVVTRPSEEQAEVRATQPPPEPPQAAAPAPPSPSQEVSYGTTRWRVPGLDWLAVSRDGKTLVAARRHRSATLVDPGTGAHLRTFDTNDPVALSSDGTTLATTGGYGDGARVAIVDVASGAERKRVAVTCSVTALALSPDGALVAWGCKEGSVEVRDAATGAARHAGSLGGEVRAVLVTSESVVAGGATGASVWTMGVAEPRGLPHGDSEVTALASTPDGRLVTADRAGVVRFFDADLATTVDTGSSYMITSLAIADDASVAVAAGYDGAIHLLERAGRRATLLTDTLGGTAVAMAADGTIWGGGGDGALRSWTRDGTEIPREPRGHLAPVGAMAVSPDGARLYALGGSDVVVWDTASRTELMRLGEGSARVTSLALSPDGARLAAGSLDQRARVWDTASGQLLASAFTHERGVTAVAWSPDGQRLATGGRDGAVLVQTGGLGPIAWERWEDDTTVSALAWSPDGALLATGNTMGIVRLHDGATGRLVARLDDAYPETLRWVGFSPDGRTLGAAGGDDLWLFDVATGAPTLSAVSGGMTLSTAVWAAGGRELITGDSDGHVWALDAKSGAVRAHIRRPDDRIRAVALDPTGRQLFVALDDTTVVRWDLARDLVGKGADRGDDPDEVGMEVTRHRGREDRLLRPPLCAPRTDSAGDALACADARLGSERLRAPDEVKEVALSPDGRLLATGGEEGEWITVWSTADGSLVHRLRQSEIGGGPMRFLSGDRLAACDSLLGRLVLWDLAAGRKAAVTRLSCKALGTAPDGGLVVGGAGGALRFVSADGEPARVVETGAEGAVRAIASGPDGALAVTTSKGELARVSAAGEVSLHHAGSGAPWFLPDGRLVVADEQAVAVVAPEGEDDEYDEDGEDDDGDVPIEHRLPDLADAVGSALTPHGQVIVRTKEHVALIDLARPGKPQRRVRVGPHSMVAAGPTADAFVVGRDHAVELWSWAKGAATLSHDGHTGWVRHVSIGPEGALTWDGALRAFSPSAALVAERDVVAVALVPGGRRAVLLEEGAIRVLSLPDGAETTIATGSLMTPCAVSPDGALLVATEVEGAALYDLEARRRVRTLWEEEGAADLMALGPGGARIAVVRGNTVELRDGAGAEVATLELGEERITGVAFAADGRLAAAGQDGIRVWSPGGKLIASLEGHGTTTEAIAFAPDGQRLVTGDIFGDLMVWDLREKRRVTRLVAHRNVITSVSFAPGSDTFVTGSWDATALRWDLAALTGTGDPRDDRPR